MNTILDSQAEQKQIDGLCAQNFLYSKAKDILFFQIFFTVIIPIAWSLIVFFLCTNLKIWAITYAICISIIDVLFFENYQKTLKTKAAKIQEFFDCNVLALSWNDLKVGSKPDAESIKEYSDKFFLKKKAEIPTEWYPAEVKDVPLSAARIICQRSNLWWDFILRRKYAAILKIILIAFITVIFVIGLFWNVTLEKFILAILAPLLPAILWICREYMKQTEAAATLERLKESIEKVWDKAIRNNLNTEQLEQESRNFQNEIYDRRRSNPLIFDWIHKRERKRLDMQMKEGAKQQVSEALQNWKSK